MYTVQYSLQYLVPLQCGEECEMPLPTQASHQHTALLCHTAIITTLQVYSLQCAVCSVRCEVGSDQFGVCSMEGNVYLLSPRESVKIHKAHSKGNSRFEFDTCEILGQLGLRIVIV